MEDIEGDRKIGSNTLPVVFGLTTTKSFTATVLLIEIIFLGLCFIQTPKNMKCILFFTAQLVVLLIFFVINYIFHKINKILRTLVIF